jgi:hypothetical protein
MVNVLVMLLGFTAIICPFVNFIRGVSLSTKTIIWIRSKEAIPMVGSFES